MLSRAVVTSSAVVVLLSTGAPGRAALPQVPPSHGHATVIAQLPESFDVVYADAILSGTFVLGGRSYEGSIRLSLDAPGPASSEDGRLTLICSSVDTHYLAGLSEYDPRVPMAAVLSCRGSLDGAPATQTAFVLALPQARETGYGYTWQYDGSFGGA